MEGIIFDIQRFCVDDGPGIRTTVFLKGCPLNCLWCHNPESKSLQIQRYSDTGEAVGYSVSAEEVIRLAQKDAAYFAESGGGITFSGGEPFLQADFLLELLRLSAQAGLSACVETSGAAKTSALLQAVPYVDLFLYDVKVMPDLYPSYTGGNGQLILEHLDVLYQSGASIRLRCPIIPGVNDTREHFCFLASLQKKYPRLPPAELMPYHNMGTAKARRLGEIEPFCLENPSAEQIEEWNRRLTEKYQQLLKQA